MTQSYERFYIRFPGTRRPKSRLLPPEFAPDVSEAERENYPPYLRGLAALPDFLALLASNRNQTKAEIDCLTKYVRKLARRIKKARTKWERVKSDVVDSL